ncbi:MAG TPA: CHRD domain-containing protein [Myxococcaceae bacterium]|nr:CHRD domain-containing protein [Myxococcaceae bacterium]
MRVIKAVAVLSFGLALSACGKDMMTVNMAASAGGSQPGTATLTDDGMGKVTVQLNIASASDAALQQPAHIHTGTCAAPGDVYKPLTNVVAGKSTTQVTADFAEFKRNPGKYIINVHKSAAEANQYVSCGTIQ